MLPLLLVKLLPTLVTVGGSAWARHRQKKLLKEAMMKPGFQTTEFWMVAGAMLANFLAHKGITVDAAMIGAALAGVYAIARTVAKVMQKSQP